MPDDDLLYASCVWDDTKKQAKMNFTCFFAHLNVFLLCQVYYNIS